MIQLTVLKDSLRIGHCSDRLHKPILNHEANDEPHQVTRSACAALLAGCWYLAIGLALLATRPADAASNEKLAAKCLSDLRGFDSLLQKDGYWLHGSGYGYDYPIDAHNVGNSGTTLSGNSPEERAYWHVRPGYEVRTLMAAANILARRGQQQSCEALLSTTRDIYHGYAANTLPMTMHW